MAKRFKKSVALVISAAIIFLSSGECVRTEEVLMRQNLEETRATETETEELPAEGIGTEEVRAEGTEAEEIQTEGIETEETEGAAETKDTEETAVPLADFGEEVFTCGDYQYKLSSSGTAVITDYTGKEMSISIPSAVNGITVASIASRAFLYLDATEVVIPDTVKIIEPEAFCYSYEITRVHIKGNATLIADKAFYRPQDITFVCSYNSKAYIYARENKAKISLTDGKDISAAKVTLGQTRIVRIVDSEDYERIPLQVTLDGRVLQEGTDYKCIWPDWTEHRRVGTKTVTVTAIDYNANHYSGNVSVSYEVIPCASGHLCAAKKITASSVPLKWMAADGVSGYYLYRRKASGGQYKLIFTASNAGTVTYTDKGLEKDTGYQYRLAAYQKADGKIYCSNYTELTVYTDSGKKAVRSSKKVKMKTKNIKLKAKAATENYKGNWAQPSAISDFFDSSGRYTIAYGDKNYVYIQILNNKSLAVTKTIKIKKKYELLGAVAGGPDGNYYIVWGQRGWQSGSIVLSIAKYDKNGRFIKSCESYNTGKTDDTAEPFEGGNCAVAFRGDILVCYYARQMNNVHQSSTVFSVNIKDMTQNTDYDSYVSHSFDQRLAVLSNGDILFADLGDAGPRGFSLYESGPAHEWEAAPFHFYGTGGDNWIYAQLGGIGEVSTGIVLVGTSASSMTKKNKEEMERLFIQIVDPMSGRSILSGSKRKGTACGKPYTDTGIKWLTGKKEEVVASNVAVMEKDRILVMWEKDVIGGVESYYMVLSPTGKVLQKATKIGRIKLNECEEIKYKNGCVYWTTAEGKKKASVHKLYIGKFK